MISSIFLPVPLLFDRYPNTARVYLKGFTGNADMPYDFFMSRYKEVNTFFSSILSMDSKANARVTLNRPCRCQREPEG